MGEIDDDEQEQERQEANLLRLAKRSDFIARVGRTLERLDDEPTQKMEDSHQRQEQQADSV